MAIASVSAAFLLQTHRGSVRRLHSGVTIARIFLVRGLRLQRRAAEETVFRGFLHTAIERESGPWAAVLLTAPLFAVLHCRQGQSRRSLELGQRLDLLLRSFAPLGTPALAADACRG